MNKKFYLLAKILVVLLIVFIAFLFTKNILLSSDSSYYGQISNQMVKDQKIVVSVTNMDNRPVQYPQLFFVANAVFTLFLGEYAYRIILFFVSIFIILLLYKTFSFKNKSYNLILLVVFSAIFFSSSFFYTILRYKIETFLFFDAVILLYLFSRKKQNISILILFSLFVGAAIASKQFGFIFLPLIFILPFFDTIPLKKKLQKLFIGLVIIFLIIAPFYIVLKASTGFFTGVYSMNVPYLDNLKIKLKDISCTGICQELINPNEKVKLDQLKANLVKNDGHKFSMTSLIASYQQFINGVWMTRSLPGLILLGTFFAGLFFYLNRKRRQISFMLILVPLSLFAYIKIASIWTYWLYASFLYEILIFFIIISLAVNLKNNALKITCTLVLLVLVLIPSSSSTYQNIYLGRIAGQKVISGILGARQFIPNNFYALSNRATEPSYYFDKPFLIEQAMGRDYLIEKDKNSNNIWQSFWDKNQSVFIDSTKIRKVNYVLFIKNIRDEGAGDTDIRPAFKESLAYFEKSGIIKKGYENSEVAIYKINN